MLRMQPLIPNTNAFVPHIVLPRRTEASIAFAVPKCSLQAKRLTQFF